MSVTWLDIVLAVLIAAAAVRGYVRGLVREGMAFGGLAVGLILAAKWYAEVAEVFRPFVGGGRFLDGLAYLFVVLAILGAATLLTVVAQRLLRLLLVGWLDGLGGLVFGAAQGAIVATILLILMVRYPAAGLDKAAIDSGMGKVLLSAAPAVLDLLPPELSAVAEFFGRAPHP